MQDSALTYRFAAADEIGAVARLVTHSFPGAARTAAFWEDQLRQPRFGGGPETLFIGLLDGRIVAALQLHRFQQWIGGTAFPVAGVGTVTISPAHRKRGLAAELMTAALRAAHERGDAASALYPFRTSFYRRLGYGEAGTALQYQLPPHALPDAPQRAHVEVLDADSARAEALRLYHEWARTQNGQLARGEMLWRHLCGAPDHALFGYRSAAGELEGYALVIYRTDLPRRDRYLEVDELVWTTPDARRGLYAWLASLGDQWEQLLVRALPAQRMSDWIREPGLPHGSAPNWRLWAPAATLLMGPMLRLVDVRSAWLQRAVHPDARLTLAFDVTDPQLEHNEGRHHLRLQDGRIVSESGAAADITLRLDMPALSRLFIGSLSATQAFDAGLLSCDDTALLPALDDALALPEPWTFDRF